MDSKNNIRLRLLTYSVMAYMLLAFTWWAVLLFTKNRDAFYAKRDLLRIGMIAEGRIVGTDEAFFATPAYQALEHSYRRQEWMILGEALVFVFSLIVGIWLINRGYNREVMAARQRRNFLLSITHELKSPIASIKLVFETLLRRELKREQFEKLNKTGLHETERLHMLVEDLLLSAKLETAYQPYLEPLDLAELLQEWVQKLQVKYSNARFHFHTTTTDTLLYADRSGLTSVIINLLENAVKYSPEQPSIDVRLQQYNGSLIIEVADQGIGISERDKKQIFEKFYRVGNEDTRKTKGTGLGLYIVEQIVKAHRGQINILDNVPCGTVFRIELPKEKMTVQIADHQILHDDIITTK
ncbi:MAG TPA: HAMP domain-containing sensor histidine kinase [Saprospiraceae bacterium]|nr:HAMP domain-containing sensor histidine kinase [Saprospiraceae bacterium]HMP12665.1 HAMP domain-containing sensor histidine kinase [Saprospiraceae bacterium]